MDYKRRRWILEAPPFNARQRLVSRWAHSPETDPVLLALERQDIYRVPWEAPLPARRMVERFAYYFRREFEYDAVQYRARESRYESPPTEAFLFTLSGRGEPDELAVGACCFRDRRERGQPAAWAMQWIWLHPFVRSRGTLKRAYPLFRQRFGNFEFEPPLSRAMAGFVARYVRPGEPAPPAREDDDGDDALTDVAGP